MNLKNVDERVFIKNDEPQINDLFVVVSRNKHQTPYLIISDVNIVALVNLHSGQKNYIGKTIDELIENYLEKNDKTSTNNINPMTGYFFVKGFKVHLSIQETFGYKSIGQKERKKG